MLARASLRLLRRPAAPQTLLRTSLPAASATNTINSVHNNNNSSRRTFLTKMAYNASKSVMPPISETEQVALGCGTIGFDKEIFTGSPSLKSLIDTYQPKLTEEEQR